MRKPRSNRTTTTGRRGRGVEAGRSICFVDSTHAPWGAEESLLTLAGSLHDADIRVSLLCRSPALADAWKTRVNDSVQLRRPSRRRGRLHRLRDCYWFVLNYGALRRHSDVVVFSYHLIAPAVLLRQALRGRFTLTLDLHDYILPGRGRSLLRRCVAIADRVIAVSRFAATPVEGAGTPTTVLYRPVTHHSARATGALAHRGAGQQLIVGIIGRLEPSKQHPLAIRAVALLFELPVTLAIRGNARVEDSGYEQTIRRLASEMLGERARFEGRVPTAVAYQGLHAVVVANDHEAMGRTVAEAQLHGLAVIVPDSGGAQELVDDGHTGLTFRSGSVDDLAACIRWILDNEDARLRLGSAGRDAAMLRHNPEDYARRYLAAITGNSNVKALIPHDRRTDREPW